MENLQPRKSGDQGQLVTFRLGRELYGIDIFKIQEVLHFREVTAIPHAPEFIVGVIEVRDRVIPVVDLRQRLGVAEGEGGKRRLVILDLEDRALGVIVDEISQVLLLDHSHYEALPEAVLGDRDTACISRLAKTPDGLVIVLSPERILSGKEKAALKDFEADSVKEPRDVAPAHGTAG